MSKTFIIAEIGQAHEGSLGILHSYINALADTGVDAIKFQTHIAEAESSEYEPFRVKFSYEDDTRYDYWKRMEFTLEQWKGIKKHCDEVGLEFISSPFSNMAVDWLEEVGVKKYKIGSGEVSNYLMLEKIAKTGKEIILSSGMSSFAELDDTINFLKQFGNKLSVLQCTTKYPTSAEDIGLNVINELKERYELPIGLSDHSSTIYPSLSAVSLGADILEFHVIFDKSMFGPDSKSSLTINEVKQLVEGVRFIEKSVENKIDKTDNSRFKELKNIFEKSLAVNKDLKAGDIITFDDLEAKKPSNYGISAKEYKKVLGKSINKNMRKWDFLAEEDINE
ncbi:N-acetylneuraminate synthase family protein [Aliarcobacter butzleri]|uniref:N-acetylneuraminate synthase family protein n=1 Tax=Aliarcobacter butzleri TaxID=28197 RepID=UPI001EDF0BAA|nr:N-acetylneuraminate synthase family protein [Aliarcobacter butzleri]MCG3670043.1 N-acetylneuraminate synthase family protein [Aliarcobacter butzleri]